MRPSGGTYLAPKRNAAGLWEITWTENGRSKRRSTGTADRREAETILARFILHAAQEHEREAGPYTPTVAEVMHAYLVGHVAAMPFPKSKKQWDACCRMVAASALGQRSATELTPRDVASYAAARAAGTVGYEQDGKRRGFRSGGPAASRNEILCLNAATSWAVSNRIFSGLNPATRIPCSPPAAPPRREHFWTHAQGAAMLAAAQAHGWRLGLFVAIGLDTAARKEAIETLTWDRVTVWKDDADVWRAEIDTRDPERATSKKRRGENVVSAPTAALLADAKAKARSKWVLGEPTSLEWQFRRVAKATTGKAVGPHIMRHSWATWAVAAGLSSFDVAGVLHATPRMVENVYAKQMQASRTRAVNDVAALISAAAAEGK